MIKCFLVMNLVMKKNQLIAFLKNLNIFFSHFNLLQISKSLKTQNGQCTILKHSVVRRPGQICLSKKAVTQCATGCQPIKPEPLLKKISFTCFKEDRVAEHYAKKAERGQKMTELAGRPTAFEAEVPQPMSCVPASNYL